MDHPGFFELIRLHLRQPEYLHVFLHPLPIYGVALGALALVIGMLQRSRQSQVAALILLVISAGSAWPVKELGEKAYDHIEATADHDSYLWLDAHGQRAEKAVPVFYALALAAAVALAVPWKFPKSALALNALTLLLCLAAMTAAFWIATAGGQVQHREFRYGMPSEQPGGYEKIRD